MIVLADFVVNALTSAHRADKKTFRTVHWYMAYVQSRHRNELKSRRGEEMKMEKSRPSVKTKNVKIRKFTGKSIRAAYYYLGVTFLKILGVAVTTQQTVAAQSANTSR